jgi:exo-beta-1,3-glucanase (GH17 family)
MLEVNETTPPREQATPPKRDWVAITVDAILGGAFLAVFAFLARLTSRLYERHGLTGPVLVFVPLVLVAGLSLWLWHSLRASREDDGASGSSLERRAQAVLILAFVLALTPYLLNELLGPLYSKPLTRTDAAPLINRTRWIAYEPQYFSPYSTRQPTLNSIDQELGWIRDAGYEGIITFSSNGILSRIPKSAKSKGLSVIMGVWSPTDRVEIRTALSQRKYVDAYAVGHNGLHDGRYSYHELIRTIEYMRFHAQRPISTTEPITTYFTNSRLRTVGDWLFPDAHIPIKDAPSNGQLYHADPQRDAEELIKIASDLIGHIGEQPSQPVLLKMVSYPTAGIPDASPGAQAVFFSSVLDSLRDGDLPGVQISLYGAFDPKWKKDLRSFRPWDPYTGLLDGNGYPRLATLEISNNMP